MSEKPEPEESKSVIALLKKLEQTLEEFRLGVYNRLDELTEKTKDLKKILTSEEW